MGRRRPVLAVVGNGNCNARANAHAILAVIFAVLHPPAVSARVDHGCADDDGAVAAFAVTELAIEDDPSVVTCAAAAAVTRQLLCADTYGACSSAGVAEKGVLMLVPVLVLAICIRHAASGPRAD